MSDYRDIAWRAIDGGLNLRDSPDEAGPSKWRRLNNTGIKEEGAISTRDGRALFVSTGSGAPVHTLKRIGEGSLLVGTGTSLFVNSLSIASGFSGNPLSATPFRPAVSPTVWTYIGDSVLAMKVKEDGTVFKWGVNGPTVPSSFAASTTAGNLDSSVPGSIVYDWRYTYYSTATGAESNPSDAANGIAVVGFQANVGVTASLDPQVDQIRVYRRGGTIIDEWRLSLTASNLTAVLTDNNADSVIAENEALSEDNDIPFTSVDASGNPVFGVPLPFVAGPFQGKYMLACGDPNRPGYLYWTNTENPDGAASSNNVQITSPLEPLINVFLYGEQPYAWSRNNLYKIDFGQASGATFQGRLTPCGRGLAASWAFAAGGPLIYFLSEDGIYVTNGDAEAVSITDDSIRPLFNRLSVENFAPVDYSAVTTLRLAYVGLELHFHYQDTNGDIQELIYHTLYKRWRSADSENHTATLSYHDENQSVIRLLIGATNGNVYDVSPLYTNDAGTQISVNARTAYANAGIPQMLKEYGNVIVDANPSGTSITVTPVLDSGATSLTSDTISGGARAQFPLSLLDTYAYSLALDFAWQGSSLLYGGTFLWRTDEEVLTHWECPETDHGLSGWQHARDMYVSIRSTGDVTFTHTIDGNVYTYTVPSTGGAKRKVYVRLSPTKGKVFRYAFDAVGGANFRLYGKECEVRVKPWNTALGYKPTSSPFEKLGAPPGSDADAA